MVSKIPSEENEHASEVNEGQKVVDVSVVPDEDASVILKPGKEAFDFPAMGVPAQRTTILCRRLDATVTVRGDQLDALPCQLPVETVAVVGAIPD